MLIESEYELPELPPALETGAAEEADLRIGAAELADRWEQAQICNDYLALLDGSALVRIPGTAVFEMREGRELAVSVAPNADLDKVRLYVLGTCMGIVLMQRKVLPLHGSAIAVDGKAYAIVGMSGAGKSTLAAHLVMSGYRLASDDLIAVRFGEDGRPYAMPAYPQQKIWQESLELLGMSKTGLRPLADRETKFSVPVRERFCSDPLPLAGIFELVKSDKIAAVEPIAGLERFQTLLKHTFRGSLLKRLGLMEWHFQTSAAFAGRLPMHRLYRPAADDSVRELAARLLETIDKEEN